MADMQKLVAAIRRHSGMTKAEIIEAAEHGADAGWPNFTYTNDAAEFYEQNKEAIWELLNETADSQGVPVLQMIASFNRSDMAGDVYQFENLLAWFALEEAGHYLTGGALTMSDLDLDQDAPDKISAVLRAAAEAYRESSVELESAWGDKQAGRPWKIIARILEQAADRIDASV